MLTRRSASSPQQMNGLEPISLITPRDTQPIITNDGTNGNNPYPLSDPIEQMSKLHLDLYQCLNQAKAAQKKKKEMLKDKAGNNNLNSDQPIPPHIIEQFKPIWLERFFELTEAFIAALGRYYTNGERYTDPSETPIKEHKPDSATTLLIISAHARLLQILEVLIFMIETYREFKQCKGIRFGFVQMQIGGFTPAHTEALQANLLGQYVLHLLDSISLLMNKMVGDTMPAPDGGDHGAAAASCGGGAYVGAVEDTMAVERQLRERIALALTRRDAEGVF